MQCPAKWGGLGPLRVIETRHLKSRSAVEHILYPRVAPEAQAADRYHSLT